MAEGHKILSISVIWRAKEFIIEISANSFLSELGLELHRLTNVKLNTMRLLVPQSSNKGSKLLLPFSEDHSSLSLQQINIQEGKSVRMMGVFEDEIEEVSNNGKPDLRILGFEEEEKRLRQRSITRPVASLKLPQGPYTFHDFRTLQLPGIELHPPASEALGRMHMLASDPGIIAIMNKHRWQVGIMTEMAPVGYVGISPKCILGFNKNHGEEISLRLRTDDLKGFRKYESIKKTLLHELAHMVYSEHDSDFFSLDRQLNQEAADLDWTKSRSHTLSGRRQQDYHEEEYPVGEFVSAQKLGGNSNLLVNPRVSSVAAAYGRLLNASATAEKELEPDPDDSNHNTIMEVDNLGKNDRVTSGFSGTGVFSEPDPDDSVAAELLLEPDPDDAEASLSVKLLVPPVSEEPDPDDSDSNKFGILKHGPDSNDSQATENSTYGGSFEIPLRSHEEPDPDDCREEDGIMVLKPDTHDIDFKGEGSVVALPFSSDNQAAEPDPDDKIGILASRESSLSQDQELQRINESASVICARLHNAIERLKSEVTPAEAVSVLHTLFKIIRNVIEHPDDMKFRKLRKANPVFQRNVANYKAAMEVLSVVGFHEDLVRNEIGMAEAYVVLKRNDLGLLWLVKSSLEMCIA